MLQYFSRFLASPESVGDKNSEKGADYAPDSTPKKNQSDAEWELVQYADESELISSIINDEPAEMNEAASETSDVAVQDYLAGEHLYEAAEGQGRGPAVEAENTRVRKRRLRVQNKAALASRFKAFNGGHSGRMVSRNSQQRIFQPR